ncbi:MAG: glycogen debranching protein GlgX [Candidatus Thermoplasmatota archaeon]|nr:glycogen debranching protein GlgX [Candidatus Thermoplasmatota archaeon]MCL6014452.1 glycogen debranching protein GlgX [Candidatus Thermoplasmatota archaeon]
MGIVSEGKPYPLGSTLTNDGVNFAIYSEDAESIELALFKPSDLKCPNETISMKEVDAHVWHCEVSGIKEGQLYGYYVGGPFDPSQGLRFNKNKLLIDPYAKSLNSKINWDDSIFPYDIMYGSSVNNEDDTEFMPKSMVVNDLYDWQDVRKPERRWNDTIIYETHVKSITQMKEDLDKNIRGTYSALGSSKVINYLKDLGITAVELMPVQQHVDDKVLVDRGLTNYWGYNTIAYFAPDLRYSTSHDNQIKEFKDMVFNLHSNGIEVILDVVYNHTAEGNHMGPLLSFRGIDNRTYYFLDPSDPSKYVDFTGTGNSLNVSNPQVLQMIMDSLRYWAIEMQIDGFRFDLASTLARNLYSINMLSPFMNVIHQDPVLSRLKLIAEPWDIGPGGYQVGNFPPKWSEWNGKYRDSLRKYWRGDDGMIGEFATRISGSPDLYDDGGKRPHSSINFVTCHDGFTLMDLVSYNTKHNEANTEGFEGGIDENYSFNYGVEGRTEDKKIMGLRYRSIKNFFLSLFVSQGTPMILGGDEIGRTQQGNNNAYCQDNEISWYDWNMDEDKQNLYKFVKKAIALRRSNPVLARKNFFRGDLVAGTEMKDVVWLDKNLEELKIEDWKNPSLKHLMVWINGEYTSEVEYSYRKITGGDLLLLFNSSDSDIMFKLPNDTKKWELYLDTNILNMDTLPIRLDSPQYLLKARGSAILREIV